MPRPRLAPGASPLKRWIADNGFSYEEVALQLAALGWPVSGGHVRNLAHGKPITSVAGLRAIRRLTKLPEAALPLPAAKVA